MDTSVSSRRRTWFKRLALASLLGFALVAVAMGVAVYHFFNDRPGEGALHLVPANALVAVSVDLSPSASQAMVFKKIDDALARNDLKGVVENGFSDILDQGKEVPALRDLATRSGAFALLAPNAGDKKNSDPTIFFLGLTDGQKAVQAIAKALKMQFYKGTPYYVPKNGGLAMTVIGDELVVSPNPQNLHAVKQVADKEKPGMVDAPEYAAARASLDSDANVMVFLNPAMLKTTDPKNERLAKVADSIGWVAMGVAVRDGGISLSVHGTMDPDKFTALKALADLKPLRSDLYKVLPSGAYGAVAVAQEGAVIDAAMATASDFGAKDDLEKFKKDFAKSSGVDIENDLVPALQGNIAIAFYPSEKYQTGGLDVLAMVDDQNGADPAKVADKLRAAIDKSFADQHKQGPFMERADDGEGATWMLAPNVEQDMRDGLEKAFDAPEIKGEMLSVGKTVVYTTRGKTVFVSTSRKLMERALNTYKTGTGSVADDASFVQPGVLEGSQDVMILNVAKIAKGVAATLNFDKMDKDAAGAVQGILSMFDTLNVPLYGKGSFSSTSASGTLFIPLDYDKLADFIGAQMHKNNGGSTTGRA